MVSYFGDFTEDDTVDIPFNTFTSDDPAASSTITNFVNTDVHIHKDGGLIQRNNAAGITVSVNFDGITGNHLVKIDTSDDTVGGFWTTGSEYQVRIEGTTVDAGTINAWIGAFSIERAGGTIALLKLIQAAVITNATGVDVAADIIAVKAETATIVNDTDVIDDATSGLVKIASDVAAVLVDTAVIGAAGAGLTNINLPNQTMDVIGNITGDLSGSVGSVAGAVGSVTGHTNQTSDHTASIAAIPTTAMRGTDNAALASVVGVLADAAAAGEVTEADTLMKYIKQIINILIGTPGIGTFPAEAAPANAVSLAEVIRAIHADVTGLNGSAMVGTDGANTVVPDAAGIAPTAIEIQAEMEENGASILDTLRDDLADGGRLDLLIDAIKAKTDELIIHETTIASVTDDKTFVLTSSGLDGDTAADDDAWNNCSVTIEDVTGTAVELRKVSDYGGEAKQIILDRLTKFNLAAGDIVKFYPSYSPTAAAGSVTEENIADIADAVHDEAAVDHDTIGTMGYKLNHAKGGRYGF